MKIKNLLLTVLFSLGLIALTIAEEPTTNSAITDTGGVEQQLEGFNLNGYDSKGQKTWEVNGEKADISAEKIKVTNVDANFYGKQNANLTSKTGTIDKINGQVHLQDDVVITSDRGTTMTTDSLDWNRNQDIVSTKDPVKITDEQGVVTGVGMTAHPNLKEAAINQDVKAVLNTKSAKQKNTSGSQKVTITCDGPMQMDQLKAHVTFTENVVAIEEASGRQLYADQMDVWFDEKNKKIKKVICKGHVKAVQGDSASYADEMIYTGESELLVMKGRPKIVFDTADSEGGGMFQKIGK